jgi:hypothetical protein
VTGRSLGRCNTAALICGGSVGALVLLVALVVELFVALVVVLFVLPGALEADWLWPSVAVGGFFTSESVRNPPLV